MTLSEPRYATRPLATTNDRCEATRHDDDTCDLGLSFPARHQSEAVRTHDRDRRQWQRQIEPLSRAEITGGHRARPHHPIPGCRRRFAIDIVGGPGIIFPRDESRHPARARHGAQKSRQPEAWILGRGLRLRHRSRTPAAGRIIEASRATRRSNPKACGPANDWAGQTPLRFATAAACGFETTPANGGRPTSTWRRSTA